MMVWDWNCITINFFAIVIVAVLFRVILRRDMYWASYCGDTTRSGSYYYFTTLHVIRENICLGILQCRHHKS